MNMRLVNRRSHRRALCVALVLLAACGGSEVPAKTAENAAEAEHQEAPPGELTLSAEANRTAGIATELVTLDSTPASVALEVPGQVEFDPRRVALITPRTGGRIERLMVVTGDRVSAGQPVALIYSAAFAAAQQDFILARRRATLLRDGQDAEGADALARAARQRLITLGAAEASINRLAAGGDPEALLAVRAPFGGSIMDSDVLTGAMVEAGDSLFRLADLSVVDVIAQVPERALPLVRVGQRATIEIVAFPGMRFDGEVERLREELNPETRTVEAVIHARNPAGRLRPGMYATVRLAANARDAAALRTGNATSAPLLTIPESAVITDGDEKIVFVELAPLQLRSSSSPRHHAHTHRKCRGFHRSGCGGRRAAAGRTHRHRGGIHPEVRACQGRARRARTLMMIDRLVAWSVRRRYAVLAIVAALAVAGIGAFRTLRVEALPDLTDVQVQVLVEAPGLSPVEVERLIAFPIEVAMNGLPRVTLRCDPPASTALRPSPSCSRTASTSTSRARSSTSGCRACAGSLPHAGRGVARPARRRRSPRSTSTPSRAGRTSPSCARSTTASSGPSCAASGRGRGRTRSAGTCGRCRSRSSPSASWRTGSPCTTSSRPSRRTTPWPPAATSSTATSSTSCAGSARRRPPRTCAGP